MDVPVALPSTTARTRRDLQRVATHVIARRRHALVGRFGLRASPGGLAAPAAGPAGEVLRTDGDHLVVERDGRARAVPMTTLGELAAAAGVDLGAPFSVGADTPPVGDADAPLAVDPLAARALGAWWGFATTALDEVVAWLGPGADAGVAQIWPEHFDVGCDVAWGPDEGARANMGGSPGDAGHPDPYLYLGPWGPQRPGAQGYWNAPFGAVLGHSALLAADDPLADAVAFLRRGLEMLAG